jgi:hypothetical protein
MFLDRGGGRVPCLLVLPQALCIENRNVGGMGCRRSSTQGGVHEMIRFV